MPEILLCLLLGVVVGFCKRLRQVRANKPRPLCLDCAHAHMQYAPNGRCAIACTFAGSVPRAAERDVLHGLLRSELASATGLDRLRA